MDSSKYGKHIVTKLTTPGRMTPEFNAGYATWAKRILYLDDDLLKGAFQMNCSWYIRPPDIKTPEQQSHRHEADEILGFFSSDPEKPYELGAELELWLEDEMYIITSSAMVFVPKGMKHCPLILRRIDRPVFHFSVLTRGLYDYLR